MIFDINDHWGKYYHRNRGEHMIDLLEWLDEYVGWQLTEGKHFLPIYGQGWRITGGVRKMPDSEYPHYTVTLEIDDDTLALQYKLAFN